MTVNVSKPAINVREKLAELDKPTGIAGEAMLRAETPQEQFNLIGAGRRNLIINGAMQVWQRGTGSQAVTNGDYELADRWIYFINGATATTSQQSFTVGQTSVPSEPEYFLRTSVAANSGASDYCILAQHIEGVRTAAGQTVTVSFWAKSSVNGNQIGVEFNQTFGGGGSSRVTTTGGSEAVTLSTEWQKYTVTKQIGSIAGKTIGSSDFFELYFWMSSGSTYAARSASIGNQEGDFDITGVQLEVGKVATPFEHRSYGEELALCQRYFQTLANGELVGSKNTSSRMRITAKLTTELRSAPTVSRVSGTTVAFQGVATTLSSTNTAAAQGANSGLRHMAFDLGGFSSLADRSYGGADAYATTAVFHVDAEL
jgi:hypothetical protein